MRRYLQVELDARYFDIFGEAFIKSFYAHNKGWDLYVSDVGLAPEQVEVLSRYGVVKRYPVDPTRRWLQLTARVQSLCDIVKDDALIYRIDTDGFITANEDDLVKSFLDGGYDVYAMPLPYALGDHLRNIDRAAKLLDVPKRSRVITQRGLTFSYALMRGTPTMMKAFDWLQQHWAEIFACGKDEETIISAVFYKFGVKFRHVNWKHFHPGGVINGHTRYQVPSPTPFARFSGCPTSGIHFVSNKYGMLNSSAWSGNECWRAWEDVAILPYKRLPWPNPEDVRCHQTS